MYQSRVFSIKKDFSTPKYKEKFALCEQLLSDYGISDNMNTACIKNIFFKNCEALYDILEIGNSKSSYFEAIIKLTMEVRYGKNLKPSTFG